MYLELYSDDQWRLYRTMIENLKAECTKNKKNMKKRVYAERLLTVPGLENTEKYFSTQFLTKFA